MVERIKKKGANQEQKDRNPNPSSIDYLKAGMALMRSYLQNSPYKFSEEGTFIPPMKNFHGILMHDNENREFGPWSTANFRLPVLDNRESYEAAVVSLDEIAEDLKACFDLNPLIAFYLIGRTPQKLLEILGVYNPIYKSIIDNFQYQNIVDTLNQFNHKEQIRAVCFPENGKEMTFIRRSYLDYQLQDLAILTGYVDPEMSYLLHDEVIFELAIQLKRNREDLKKKFTTWNWEKIDKILDLMPDGHTMFASSLENAFSLTYNSNNYAIEKEEYPFIFHPPVEWTEGIARRMAGEQAHDEEMMEKVLEEAKKALEGGNAEPFACMIENSLTGEVISATNTKPKNKQIHAEINALDMAFDAWGAETVPYWKIYVSLEPCVGCGQSIYQTYPGIKSVTYSADSGTGAFSIHHYDTDSNFQNAARQDDQRIASPQVRGGILAEAATDFYRNTVGWNKQNDHLVQEYDPKKLGYWQKKWQELLTSQNIEPPPQFSEPTSEEILERTRDYIGWFNDPDIRKGLAADAPADIETTENWLRSLIGEDSNNYRFIRVNGKVIGHAGLKHIDTNAGTAEVGILIEKEYWGKGIGWAALEEIKKIAKEKGLKILTAIIEKDNIRSVRLFTSHGFRKIEYPQKEEPSDDLWYFTLSL